MQYYVFGMKGRRNCLGACVCVYCVYAVRDVRILHWKRNLWLYPCDSKQASQSNTKRMGEHILFNRNKTTNCGHTIMRLVCVYFTYLMVNFIFQNQTLQSSSHVKMTNDNIYSSWSISWRSPERIRWPRKRKCCICVCVFALCSIAYRVRFITHFTSHYSIWVRNWCNENEMKQNKTKRNEKKARIHTQIHVKSTLFSFFLK